MNNLDIAKGLIFKSLHLCDKNSLANRVIIQKKIYLLQAQAIDLGYEYNWYLKGPYSPTLTSYVYDNLDILNSMEYKDVSLNSAVLGKIEQVNNLNERKPSNLDQANWYELLASMVYIYRNNYMWNITRKMQDIISILLKEKPKYNNDDCEAAFNILIEKGFIEVN